MKNKNIFGGKCSNIKNARQIFPTSTTEQETGVTRKTKGNNTPSTSSKPKNK